MTCKNIRSGKQWLDPEIQVINRLKWVNEIPGRSPQNIFMAGYMFKRAMLYGFIPQVTSTSFGSV